eukprot:6490856-Amphidinium_carterae.1
MRGMALVLVTVSPKTNSCTMLPTMTFLKVPAIKLLKVPMRRGTTVFILHSHTGRHTGVIRGFLRGAIPGAIWGGC